MTAEISADDVSRNELVARRQAEYLRFKHYAAITCLIACPILIALPPRRLNSLTAIQMSAFGMSGNYLIHERTGNSIVGHIYARVASPSEDSPRNVPSKRAEIIQAKLRELKETQPKNMATIGKESEGPSAPLQNIQSSSPQEQTISKLDDWKVKRLQEEQSALDEGKGYGYLIKEYFRDAFAWRRKTQVGQDEEVLRDADQ